MADDDNLDIAAEHGFATVEHPNVLGAKLNAGFAWAAERGAEWFCWCGSDDWLHPDLFTPLATSDPLPPVVTGRRIAIVDLEQPRMRVLNVPHRVGAPPWIMPRWALEACGFQPFRPDRMRGLDGDLARAIRGARWTYHDPHRLARVDFKTSESLSPYEMFGLIADGPEVDPWPALEAVYPAELVAMAQEAA